jgi:hypothetical protein
MVSVLLVLVSIALAQAELTAPACPAATAGTPFMEPIIPFYKYNYEISKNAAVGSVYITVDNANQTTMGLWFRAEPFATSARGASLNVRLTKNQIGTNNDTAWDPCSLATGECVVQTTFGIPGSMFNISVNDKIYLTFFPICSTCSSTVEFTVETAWFVPPNSENYPAIPIQNNLRTMTWTQNQGGWLNFISVVTAPTTFYTDVTYPDTVANSNSQLILYFNKDAPQNGTNMSSLDMYPAGDGFLTGNYLQQRPFNASSPGTYYISTYLKVGESIGSTDFTIKVGLNAVPCAGASMISVSVLAFLLPLLSFFLN